MGYPYRIRGRRAIVRFTAVHSPTCKRDLARRVDFGRLQPLSFQRPPVLNGHSSSDPSTNPRLVRGALEAAIAHLRRGLRADGTYAGIDEWDTVQHQWQRLQAWAETEGLVLGGVQPARAGGREHDVTYDGREGRWLKFTKPNAAGYAVEIVEGEVLLLPASPLQYLQRWSVGNRLFNDDARLVGLTLAPRDRRIVISQRDVGGPYPSWEVLEREFSHRLGFRRLQTPSLLGGYDSRAYFRGRVGVFDVRPANCAQVGPEMVAPFDVIPQFFGRRAASVLQRLTIPS